MFNKKCPACAKGIKKDFNYCPYCGKSFKASAEKDNFGMLGRIDSTEGIQPELKLPFGIGKIVNSLVKQLEQEINSQSSSDESRGIKIKIAMGNPHNNQIIRSEPKRIEDVPKVSEAENERRAKLPTVEVESRIKRLGDKIIYEIKAPGVRTKEDVVIVKLASGLEIKGYSGEKCYIKFIPLTVEIIGYYVENEKIFVELKA